MSSVHPLTLAVSSSQAQPIPVDDGSAAIRAIVNPPSACPVCWIQSNHRPLPGSYTTRICSQHEAEMRARSDALKSHAK